MIDKDAKLSKAAEILEGKVVEDAIGLEVCVKGTVLGFPVTLQALRASFPFGITYVVETDVMAENAPRDPALMNLTIMPRYARGFFGFITRLFLLESKGEKMGDKKFDSKYIVSTNNHNEAERFIRYPGVVDKIEALQVNTKFNEIGVKAKAGLYLSQPTSFNAVNLDVVRASFKELGELGQVLFEAF